MSENPTPMTTPTPDRLRALLLHQLPDDEARQLEEQLMQDADVAEMLRQEETDLVDDYVLARLTAADRAGFERHLLVDPAIRQRVKIARALQEIATKRSHPAGSEARRASPRPSPWNRWPVRAAAIFVLCAFAVTLLMRATRNDVIDAPVAKEGPAASPAVGALETGPDDVAGVSSSIVLLADLQRGGQPQPVHVTAKTGDLLLQAETSSSDSSLTYRLSISEDSGRSLFSADGLHPVSRGGYVFVEVSMHGSTLGTGRRVVSLQRQDSGDAPFSWTLDVEQAR